MVKNVTYLEDLGDDGLLDLDNQNHQSFNQKMHQEQKDREQIQNPMKHKLRKSVDHRTAMNAGNPAIENYFGGNYQTMNETPNDDYRLGPKANFGISKGQPQDFEYSNGPGFPPFALMEGYQDNLNCVSVANHIASCPVCSRIHNEDQKNMYLCIITILVIVVIVLIKKIMDDKI